MKRQMLDSFEKQFCKFIELEMQQDLAHDLNHVLRVVKTAKSLCESEGAKVGNRASSGLSS